ncbi:histidine phosphatase superfamily [Aspergillus pseudodeflectus]|uniref:Histidine phosphatase superfamily n=1 Tax=Aspergillus pseudodeflectus TaxID=176178 RepID=A0ABR4JVG9_9EURO
MSDQDALTPRVFLVRHGETEWAKSGRFTGITDIQLTETGATQVSSAATTLVGPRKLLDPFRLAHIFVSPRTRAITTFKLLMGPFSSVIEIRSLWKEKGLDLEKEWNILRDGCEGGESSKQVTDRLDRLISQIKVIQRPYMNGDEPADVLLVAHGLIHRCFVKRWLGFSIDFDLQMMFAPGAIAVLSYKNNDIDKPALHVGVALPPSDEDTVKEWYAVSFGAGALAVVTAAVLVLVLALVLV